jgi:hypothetical protein
MAVNDWLDYEFFSEIPKDPAERQAALDAARDADWASESLRVRRKVGNQMNRFWKNET